MIIGYFRKDCVVETIENKKIKISELKIGDKIKCANNNFCHLYKNKLEYVADDKNIDYNKIIGLPTKQNKSVWKIWTDEGFSIVCSLSTFFKTMQRSQGLDKYSSTMLGQIFDDYESLDGEIYNFVMYCGFSQIHDFRLQEECELIGIELEKNNPIFINDFLIG